MAYSKTASRKEFDEWKKKALSTIRRANKSYTKKYNISDYMLCAVLILTHARFENYFKDIVKYTIDEINSAQMQTNSLPGRLREAELMAMLPHSYLKRYYMWENERNLLDKLNHMLNSSEWVWAKNDHVGMLTIRAVLNDQGYPSPKNLKNVFYKLGIDIFVELGKRLKTDAAVLLDSISGLRSEMAHIGMPPLVTPSDIGHKVSELARVVGCIDRIVQRKLNEVK